MSDRHDDHDTPRYPPVDGADVPYAPAPDLNPTRPSLGGAGALMTAETTIAPASAPPRKRGVSRRTVLVGAGVGAVGLGVAGTGVGALFLQQRHATPNLLGDETMKVNHLLRRAGFGPTPSEIGSYLSLGVQGALDKLLNYGAVQDDLDARLSAQTFDATNPTELMRQWLLRMLYSKRPLEEKMTLFWHGVLTSSIRDVGGKQRYTYLVTQNNLLRAKAMGRFDDLMYAISIDPAMLWYLNGRQNTGKSPNENYARELMELFTLGIQDAAGNDNYTQNDVHQGALALAGWVDQNGAATLVPGRQYTGQVTFLGHTGALRLADVIRLVCAHPSTGRHLALRLWSFFVYENPSERDLKPLIDAYYKSNHNVGEMVKVMFGAPQFFSEKAYRGRIKSPLEFVVGAIRGLGVETDGKNIPQAIAQLGQTIYDPPNVSGWDGDKVSANWLSTQTWMSRVNFINALASTATGGPTRAGGKTTTSAVAASAIQKIITANQLATPSAVSDYFVATLGDNQLEAERRSLLAGMLTQVTSAGSDFTLHGGGSLPATGLRTMLYTLMSMPEYQMN